MSASVYDRFRDYHISGFLDRILERLLSKLNEQGLIDFDLWQVDSTTIRAHKSAAGAGLKRGPKPKREPTDHALGRRDLYIRKLAREAVFQQRFTGSATLRDFLYQPF